MIELAVSAFPLVFGVAVFGCAWWVGKRVMRTVWDPPEVKPRWVPREEEWTAARLRRARSDRYRLEHELWDSQFGPPPVRLEKCPSCAHSKLFCGCSSRRVPFM